MEGQWPGDDLWLMARPTFDQVGRDGSITTFSNRSEPPQEQLADATRKPPLQAAAHGCTDRHERTHKGS